MRIKRFSLLFAAVAILATLILPWLKYTAGAADYPRLINRSLSIGTSEPGEVTDYRIEWRWPSSTTVGSVRLELCADPYVLDACGELPPGDLSGASLDSQTGALGGWSLSSATTNELLLTRGSTGASGTGVYVFNLSGIQNPTGIQKTFFIRIYSHNNTDASGTATHMASVASATATPIMITSEVPPFLFFCAGITVTPWCDSVVGDQIDYGSLDYCVTDVGTSQFGVATNAIGGYVVSANGNTLTSGNKQITNLDILTPNAPCTGQFGLNLRANTDPPFGADVSGAGIGVVAPEYDVPDQFKFVSGETIASAITGTLWNTYTVTYIVNIDEDQPSGIYNTTIAYICTAAF